MIAFCLFLLVGCYTGRSFVVAPNVFHHTNPELVFGNVPPDFQKSEMEVLYVTDRVATIEKEGLKYGPGRAKRVAFGTAIVRLDPMPTWRELVEDSVRPDRAKNYELKEGKVAELGSFNPNWDNLLVGQDGIRLASQTIDEMREQQNVLHGLLRNRLAKNSHKDAYVYIHGFNNDFDSAVFRVAELWHYLGRVGVPIAYTWPAGFGGIRGYAYDRESGEFTVFHLKQFLRTLAACPEVERIHLIAHSRGTDVTISALRELHIACRAAGKSTKDELKLENLILAAPDLDEDVFMQRFVAENLIQAAKRTTIYVSPNDNAIRLADLVFASNRRIGQLSPRDFSPKVRKALSQLPQMQVIECKVTDFSTSHDYVFAHPAALSDLILVLRDRRDPGAANGRPLQQPVEGIWELTNDYLLARANADKK